jgi:hypothetical protein
MEEMMTAPAILIYSELTDLSSWFRRWGRYVRRCV